MDYSLYFKKKNDLYKPGYNCTVDCFSYNNDECYFVEQSDRLLYDRDIHGFDGSRLYMNFIDYSYYKKYGENICKILQRKNNSFLKKENIKPTIDRINKLIDLFILVRPIFQNSNITCEELFKNESKQSIYNYYCNVYRDNYLAYFEFMNKYCIHRYSESAYLKKSFNILTDYVFNNKIEIDFSTKKYATKVYIKLIEYMSSNAIDTYNELLNYIHLSNGNEKRADFRNPVFLYVLQFAGNNMIDEIVFENKSINEVCYKYEIGVKKFKGMITRECRHHVFELINDNKLTIDDIHNKFKLSDRLFLKFAINI